MGTFPDIGALVEKMSPRSVLFAAAIVLCGLLFRQCSQSSGLREQARINEQNALALRDSIHSERADHERTYNAYKAVTVADMGQLKEVNRSLYDRLDSLKRVAGVRGSLLTATDVGASLSSPGGTVPAEVVYVSPSGDVRLSFGIDTAYDALNSHLLRGHAEFHMDSLSVSDARFTVDTDVVRVGLATGITRDGGAYRIFVSSSYPGFTVTRLDGAVLDPKALRAIVSDESPVVVGPFIGYGYGFGTGVPSPILGVGVTYNLNRVAKSIFR